MSFGRLTVNGKEVRKRMKKKKGIIFREKGKLEERKEEGKVLESEKSVKDREIRIKEKIGIALFIETITMIFNRYHF